MPTRRDFESWVEFQIREATERGEFDDLPGSGAPIPDLGGTYDPDWWGKRFVTRERIRTRAEGIRQLIREELPRLRSHPDLEIASKRVAEINEMIADINPRLDPSDRIEAIAL
jgi:hypothetical protein